MKILHIDPEHGFGGGERQVLGLLRHLARRGHENLLAAPAGSLLAEMVPPPDARKVSLAIRNDVDLLAAARLSSLIAREQPDVVHFHTSRAHAMALWLRRSAERSVVTRRMDYPIRRGWRSDLLYNRRVAAVVAISGEVRRQLLAAGVEPSRTRVIHSAVELPDGLPGPAGRRAARQRLGVEGAPVISVVAALERRKGHDVLFEALARLEKRGLDLNCLVCGDGSERGALEAQARRLGLTARVRFLGEQRQVADVLAASDLFVLPSRMEGLGVAILEAMAMALPVVASRVGGIPESVEAGRTGLLVPPEDPEALAEAIGRLAEHPDEVRAFGEAGRRRILEHFTMERMGERYEELYGELGAPLRQAG